MTLRSDCRWWWLILAIVYKSQHVNAQACKQKVHQGPGLLVLQSLTRFASHQYGVPLQELDLAAEDANGFKLIKPAQTGTSIGKEQCEQETRAKLAFVTMQELDLAPEDAIVYKLIGPTLIKQDPVEAKSNVNKRLDFIKGELSRLDARLTDHQRKASKRQQQVKSKVAKHSMRKASD